jgi:small-conductance mechanosensitive channel
MKQLLAMFKTVAPVLVALAIIAIALWIVSRILFKKHRDQKPENIVLKQLIMLGVSLLGVILFLAVIPLDEVIRGHVFTLVGILFTGVIALSSTQLMASIMAGLMLRLIHNFKTGDFIRVKDLFGRITERGLTHIEIQREDRSLTTFSNLFMVTHPFTVIRSSGTIISTNLSLGYDLSHTRIEELLVEAALKTGLLEPFVHIVELGDFSITYRIAGFLADVKRIITARSNLRKQVLDTLHSNEIEIVSPTFMNQRRISEHHKTIPGTCEIEPEQPVEKTDPENIIFDKADEAETLEDLQKERRDLNTMIEDLRQSEKSKTGAAKLQLKLAIKSAEQRLETLGQEYEAVKYKIEEP